MRRCVAILCFASLAFCQTAGEATLSGRITDAATNQPIAGAQVTYRSGGKETGTTSDANGAYSFIAAAAQPGDVKVSKTGYATLDLFSTERAMVRLKPGATETRDFGLSRPANLSGYLIDRDSGKPVPGFYVQAIRRFADDGNQGGFHFPAAPSGADGSFSIANLSPADYSLEIDPPMAGKISFGNGKPDETGYAPTWYPGVPRAEMAAPLTLAAGESREVEVRLRKRDLRHIAGSFQAPEGMEGGIRISVFAGGRGLAVEGEISKAGPFRIDSLEEGAYTIVASTITNPGGDRAFVSRTLELTDRNIDDLRLVMRPGVALRAIVTLAEEKVDVPTGIHFHPFPLDGWFPDLGTETASDHLRLADLPSGNYIPMLMLPAGYAVASIGYNGQPVTPGGAIDIEAPESAVTFVLTSRLGRVTGTVRDANQQPVPDATVTLLPVSLLDTLENRLILQSGQGGETNSDGNGDFVFSGLAPGRYKAIAVRSKDRRAFDPVFLRDQLRSVDALVLESGQTTNVDIHVVR